LDAVGAVVALGADGGADVVWVAAGASDGAAIPLASSGGAATTCGEGGAAIGVGIASAARTTDADGTGDAGVPGSWSMKRPPAVPRATSTTIATALVAVLATCRPRGVGRRGGSGRGASTV
jgi:hypothetical protein